MHLLTRRLHLYASASSPEIFATHATQGCGNFSKIAEIYLQSLYKIVFSPAKGFLWIKDLMNLYLVIVNISLLDIFPNLIAGCGRKESFPCLHTPPIHLQDSQNCPKWSSMFCTAQSQLVKKKV